MNTRFSSQVVSANSGRGFASDIFGTLPRCPKTKCSTSGNRYGMGLQLINILRDAGSDLRAGRCYFPNDELTSAGLSPAQILSEPERFQPIYRNWAEKAERGLECGMQYSRAIRNRRVRAATVLPALIGARTLAPVARGRRNRVASQDQSFAPRSASDYCVARDHAFAVAQKLDAIFGRANACSSRPADRRRLGIRRSA